MNEKRYLSPAEVCDSFLAVGARKAALPMGKMLVLAAFAGAFIALAGVASTWASMLVENLSLRRLIAGCVFPAGLAMVVFTGTELFTGNCLMSIAWLDRKITMGAMLRNWCVVYLGNFVGGAATAAMAGVFAGADLSAFDIIVRNLIPVTIGNIIGGAVVLGGGYWYIYRKGNET